jgi:hypothetical protein
MAVSAEGKHGAGHAGEVFKGILGCRSGGGAAHGLEIRGGALGQFRRTRPLNDRSGLCARGWDIAANNGVVHGHDGREVIAHQGVAGLIKSQSGSERDEGHR